jgi:transcriptional regulator with XRE-family HTH domain
MKINPQRFSIKMAEQCLTTRDLQRLGNLSRSTIAKIRNDPDYAPNPKTIGKIAKALGVTVEYLIEKEVMNGL